MSKFGLFDDNPRAERDTIEMLVGEQKSVAEVTRILNKQGFDVTDRQVNRFKKSLFDNLKEEDRREKYADLMLNSVEKVTEEYEELASKSKAMIERFESEGKDYQLMAALRDYRELLKVALKKLGFLQNNIQAIKAENINVINANELVMAIKGEQEKWFDVMEAEEVDGKFVFNKPKPELLDDFRKWKTRTKLGLPQ